VAAGLGLGSVVSMDRVGIVVGTSVAIGAVGGVVGAEGVKTQATVTNRKINRPNLHCLISYLR
jgi:hypothetical protein